MATSVRLTKSDLLAIEAEVDKGRASNTSDYIKRAILEKLVRDEGAKA